jgi:Protein of unknown function (DUF2587)
VTAPPPDHAPEQPSGPEQGDAPVQPEVLDDTQLLAAAGAVAGAPDESVTQPTKLIRIASMVRALLEEARHAPLDDAGRRLLREIHERSVTALEGVLSPELREELAQVTLPFASDTPSESELRIAQAQLVGWLEGLFHGIQATLFTQQAVAQSQFEEMRQRRAIEGGPGERTPGAYL